MVSRREFLKISGFSLASLGLTTLIGSFLAACSPQTTDLEFLTRANDGTWEEIRNSFGKSEPYGKILVFEDRAVSIPDVVRPLLTHDVTAEQTQQLLEGNDLSNFVPTIKSIKDSVYAIPEEEEIASNYANYIRSITQFARNYKPIELLATKLPDFNIHTQPSPFNYPSIDLYIARALTIISAIEVEWLNGIRVEHEETFRYPQLQNGGLGLFDTEFSVIDGESSLTINDGHAMFLTTTTTFYSSQLITPLSEYLAFGLKDALITLVEQIKENYFVEDSQISELPKLVFGFFQEAIIETMAIVTAKQYHTEFSPSSPIGFPITDTLFEDEMVRLSSGQGNVDQYEYLARIYPIYHNNLPGLLTRAFEDPLGLMLEFGYVPPFQKLTSQTRQAFVNSRLPASAPKFYRV